LQACNGLSEVILGGFLWRDSRGWQLQATDIHAATCFDHCTTIDSLQQPWLRRRPAEGSSQATTAYVRRGSAAVRQHGGNMTSFEILVIFLLGFLCVIGIKVMVTLDNISDRQIHDMAEDINSMKIIQEQTFKGQHPETYPDDD
jgi:hypothetical protein